MSNPESDGVRNNFEGQNFSQPGDGQISQQAANTYSDGAFQQMAANDRVSNALASEQMAKNGQLGNLEITGDSQKSENSQSSDSKSGDSQNSDSQSRAGHAENSQINSNDSKSLEGSEEIPKDADKAGKAGESGKDGVENIDSNGQKDGAASKANAEGAQEAMNANPLDGNKDDTVSEAPSSEIDQDQQGENSAQEASNIHHLDMPNNSSQKQMADGSPAGANDNMPPSGFGTGGDGKGGAAPEPGQEPKKDSSKDLGKDSGADGAGSIVNDRNDNAQENKQLFGDHRNSLPAQSKANDQVNSHGQSSQEHSETLDPEFSPESNGGHGKSAPESQSQKEKMDFNPESNRNKEGDAMRDAAGQATNNSMGANRMGAGKLPASRPRW
ncbi:MAG: hypothetical protein J0M35_00855 [Candidatus Obscuribacter phosphatis]|uniref:Uncharacterized protein n=1 Tax=Candidatus Obscuribacter phosphatis TaxID=1906157 RepID=A0A8J7P8L0_9BACT|nr:hypothetical protein [Candidatus Obscuribacter phosphatis]